MKYEMLCGVFVVFCAMLGATVSVIGISPVLRVLGCLAGIFLGCFVIWWNIPLILARIRRYKV